MSLSFLIFRMGVIIPISQSSVGIKGDNVCSELIRSFSTYRGSINELSSFYNTLVQNACILWLVLILTKNILTWTHIATYVKWQRVDLVSCKADSDGRKCTNTEVNEVDNGFLMVPLMILLNISLNYPWLLSFFHQHKFTHSLTQIFYTLTLQDWLLCDLRDTGHTQHSTTKELQFSKN